MIFEKSNQAYYEVFNKPKKKVKRWDKKKKKYTLKDDIFNNLEEKLKKGQGTSRHNDKNSKEDLTRDKIYSFVTYKNYKRSCLKFANFLGKNHKNVRNLSDVKINHVNDYLEYLIKNDYSPATINSVKAGISKLLGVSSKDFIKTPTMYREDITRSRYKTKRDKHISKKTEEKYSKLTSAIGGRKEDMQRIKGSDLVFKDLKLINKTIKNYPHVIIRNSKGGKSRVSPIIGKDKNETIEIVNMLQSLGDVKLCPKLPSHYDNHYYRAQYVLRAYNKIARPIDSLNGTDEILYCRKERKGQAYDREALGIVSQFLGHNREDVVTRHYLYV